MRLLASQEGLCCMKFDNSLLRFLLMYFVEHNMDFLSYAEMGISFESSNCSIR
jgi:hypothetical protein